MKRVVLGLMAAVMLAACAGHEKAGDRAAAVGDWKGAYSAYRQALANDPDSPELKSKYNQAREQALEDAQKRAQACAQVEDWNCALGESDFALSVDGGNAELAAFRARAATRVAMNQLQLATEQAQRGQFREAVDLMERATGLSQAPEVRTRGEETRRLIVTSGRARADGFRKEHNLIAAHELAQLVAGLDASQAGWAQGIAAEYEQFVTAEYERLAQEGDAARARHDWAFAQDRYRAALGMRQGGRAAPLEQYVSHMLRAEQQLANRDWTGSADGFRSALHTGQDDGYAAQQLDRVELRPYRIAVRSVMVSPVRPDGNAWVGVANPIFSRLAQRLTQMAERRGLTETVMEMAMAIPDENRPQLRVEALLADGTRLTTPARGGVYTRYDSEFVTLSNAFDEQRVIFNVYSDDPRGGELMGTVEVPVRELVEQREVALRGRNIFSLKLSTLPGDGREPGSFQGMARVEPMPPPGHPAGPPSGHAASPLP
ncbi:hypothetical protein HPC49_03250 [Pyxidicoccus fallax]|uniref:Lipoprotein n=1 Tax=Pyxidicoccus fallax TaxID=394095 RepID=A0A848L9Y9_9BACT|nr:hypothetical protein [Pyxidicoccus fallax]NMO15354.1 hypothetical protein [Pyxidicoccus fallax]NPC77274.1 hypothetical protein [Pyxidicoccus fallax]